jgi:hypothetical protein
MIFFLSTRRNRYPIDRYLASWGGEFRSVIQPIAYEDFLEFDDLIPGVYFFADLEFLTEAQRRKAVAAWDRLSRGSEDTVLFNHPTRSLLRYDLLKTLHARKINDFTVYRPNEDLAALRFPAFLRVENDHQGFRTAPVATEEELRTALRDLREAHGRDPGWLITEFCDTSGADGVFRKYSAFLLAGTIIPRHLFFSRDWCLKNADLTEEALLEEERAYLRTNPHADELIRIFGIAGLDYGRIDYGVLGGRIQVWEINTNPMIASFGSYRLESRLDVHEIFVDRVAATWRELAQTPGARIRRNYRGQAAKAALHRFLERPVARAAVRRLSKVSQGLRRGHVPEPTA